MALCTETDGGEESWTVSRTKIYLKIGRKFLVYFLSRMKVICLGASLWQHVLLANKGVYHFLVRFKSLDPSFLASTTWLFTAVDCDQSARRNGRNSVSFSKHLNVYAQQRKKSCVGVDKLPT